MRILGFSKHWPKLYKGWTFTTFRYQRGDRDWQVGELVQVVVQPRRKGGGDKLGIAKIIAKEWRELDRGYYQIADGNCAPLVTDQEAQEDGFAGLDDMVRWMEKTCGRLDWVPCMQKLTLRWVRIDNRTKGEGDER